MAARTTAQCITRREFTLAAAMAVLSGVAISVSGCGGDSSGSPASPSPTGSGSTPAGGDRVGSISANHGHSAVVTSAQLGASGGVTLNIRGTAGHAHTVALTGAELSAIAGNQRVSKESSSEDGHTHTVAFN
jgi:uncharacterized membrane protein